jgi:hypothetical protein
MQGGEMTIGKRYAMRLMVSSGEPLMCGIRVYYYESWHPARVPTALPGVSAYRGNRATRWRTGRGRRGG